MVNPRFVIKAVLSGQRLNINVPLTVAGTVNYIGVEAKCTSEWDDCTVACYVYQAATAYTAQLALIYDAERKLYYFPNAERLSLSAGEWAIWFVGVVAEDGQEKYKITSETKYFTVYEYPFASSIPAGDITLDEQAIARATDAQNKANLILDLYNAGKLRGPKGDPGDPAEIGFVQASVDSSTTNPSCVVTVTESPDNTYNMQFAFSGIKGAKGDTGATGPKGDTGAQGAPGRDGEDGQTIDDYVLVQAEQPTSETNKMWLKPTASGDPIMIPSAEEFQEVSTDVAAICEKVVAASVTQGIAEDSNGVVIQDVNGDLKIYGTSEAIRRFCFLNGQKSFKISSSAFSKTLGAGTYEIQADLTGAQTAFRIDGTYTTFGNNNFAVVSATNKNAVVTFTDPVMLGFYMPARRSYGTNETPSIFSISIKRLTAKDVIARDGITNLEAYNAIHAPGYQNAFAGLYRGFPTFVYNSDKSITVTIPASGHGRVFWTGDYEVDSLGTNRRTFTVPINYYFVYDTVEKNYAVKSIHSALSTDIICFWNTTAGDMIGPWLSYLAIQKTEVDVPAYYNDNDYLDGKVASINAKSVLLDKRSGRFFFVTDYHITDNTRISPRLIRYLGDKCGIKKTVFGGDAIQSYSTTQGGYDGLCEFVDDFTVVSDNQDMYYIKGNHEENNPNAQDPSRMVSIGTIYRLFNDQMNNIVNIGDTGNSFFFDDTTSAIRYYYIGCEYNAVISDDTIAKFTASLSSIPEGYAFFIFSHMAINTHGVIYGKFEDILNECKGLNDDSVSPRQFIGAIGGHNHQDMYVIYDNRFPVITTACDARGAIYADSSRVAGTIYEQAFDVVQIDIASSRIYLTRIGSGSDRVFSFGENAGLIT